MKKTVVFFLIHLSSVVYGQITGVVTDIYGNPIPNTVVFEENTYNSTASNQFGEFRLNYDRKRAHKIVFQSVGYISEKKTFEESDSDSKITIVLHKETVVTEGFSENMGEDIIEKVIANKKQYLENMKLYESNFYSRGVLTLKSHPSRVLEKGVYLFDDRGDSQKDGIVFISETFSKIMYEAPRKIKEEIKAFKTFGEDNGFSFNRAWNVDFDFYQNRIQLNFCNIISPIADNANNYYTYKLEAVFQGSDNKKIYKIKVLARRVFDPVVEGFVYISENNWAIYSVDLKIKGSQIKIPRIVTFNIKQNYYHNNIDNIWVKSFQKINFEGEISLMSLFGDFSYIYYNFNKKPVFNKKTFSGELVVFPKQDKKEDDSFWETRPLPLTPDETTEYFLRNLDPESPFSKKLLDSLDRKKNVLKPTNIISGYTFHNSFKGWKANSKGIINDINFNTVQGWNVGTGLLFTIKEHKKTVQLGTDFNYGFSEKRFRYTINFVHRYNDKNQNEVQIYGGNSVFQFNESEPITPLVNTLFTLFLKLNFMKLYESNFATISYQRKIREGVLGIFKITQATNSPLFNTTDQVFIQNSENYTSNNPVNLNDHTNPVFEKYNLTKAHINFKIKFNDNYSSVLEGDYGLAHKYPTINIDFKQGFAGSSKKYNYEQIKASMIYEVGLGNIGKLAINTKVGKFFNADGISFVDYQHFNGNETNYLGFSSNYLNIFNLMPYYSHSTNTAYTELHMEHDDRGFLSNKVPFLRRIEATLTFGYHLLAVPDRYPYSEYSVGLNDLSFGKFRKMFRLDYIHSIQGSAHQNGLIIGFKFLN